MKPLGLGIRNGRCIVSSLDVVFFVIAMPRFGGAPPKSMLPLHQLGRRSRTLNFERAPDLKCDFGAGRYFAAPHKSVAIGVMVTSSKPYRSIPICECAASNSKLHLTRLFTAG
jgi:hypothetical protein